MVVNPFQFGLDSVVNERLNRSGCLRTGVVCFEGRRKHAHVQVEIEELVEGEVEVLELPPVSTCTYENTEQLAFASSTVPQEKVNRPALRAQLLCLSKINSLPEKHYFFLH